MGEIRSKYNPTLTLDYIQSKDENMFFDRKSALVSVADLAKLISAFANAEGGTIAIGVNEKNKEIEGISFLGTTRINDIVSAPKDGCKPMPKSFSEFLNVKNRDGEDDQILLIHIESCTDQVIRTVNDSTYLRIGDRTKEIKGDDLRHLEYSKSVRHFEDECNYDATLSDLDSVLLSRYQEILKAEEDPIEQVLSARGFLKTVEGRQYLTNAAVLLFAKNIQQFYPNCRIRFIRYDGIYAGTGTDINIIRDQNIECPLLRIIDSARSFIDSQLREFVALNRQTGRFQTVPEYPEFAWLEGVVNAVTHREYAMTGRYIKVSMYDDRLEIESPGKLPNIVTVENIRETRYSRNPRISRVLNDFGWVRELNEGVKRIYADMEKFFLDDPIYSEPEHSVRLVLKNNIVMRSLRKQGRVMEYVGEQLWDNLDDLNRQILVFMASNSKVNRSMLEQYTKRSSRTINNRLNSLISKGVIRSNGNNHDPKRTYSLVYSDRNK